MFWWHLCTPTNSVCVTLVSLQWSSPSLSSSPSVPLSLIIITKRQESPQNRKHQEQSIISWTSIHWCYDWKGRFDQLFIPHFIPWRVFLRHAFYLGVSALFWQSFKICCIVLIWTIIIHHHHHHHHHHHNVCRCYQSRSRSKALDCRKGFLSVLQEEEK